MIEFKVIHKETLQDHSRECFIANDGKYYFVYYDYGQIKKEEVDLNQYNIVETKYHYPFYSLHD